MFPRQSEVLTYLRRLGYTGTVDDCTYNYLRDLTGLTGLALPDLISYYLGTFGFTGGINDRVAKLEASGIPLFTGVQASFTYKMLALPAYLQSLGFTYTRNSPKTVYQNNALVTLSANQFGTTYDAVTGLYAYEAEPAATNLATNSAGAAATWTVTNVVDAVTPISGFAASLAFGDNSVQRSAYKSVSLTSGTTYNASVFIVMDDGLAPVVGKTNSTGDFSIVIAGILAGTVDPLVTHVGGSLYRVSTSRASGTTGATSNGVIKYVGQSARTFRVIGIQVETGSRATSYIATAGSTVTRAADVLSCAVANIPGFSAAGYTLGMDGRVDVVPTGNQFSVSISDTTTTNRASLFRTSTTSANIVVSGAAAQAGQSIATTSVARGKSATSLMLNQGFFSREGVDAAADTVLTMPVAPTTFYIGCQNGSGQFNGYIYRVRLIPTALNQAQTTGLTA